MEAANGRFAVTRTEVKPPLNRENNEYLCRKKSLRRCYEDFRHYFSQFYDWNYRSDGCRFSDVLAILDTYYENREKGTRPQVLKMLKESRRKAYLR